MVIEFALTTIKNDLNQSFEEQVRKVIKQAYKMPFETELKFNTLLSSNLIDFQFLKDLYSFKTNTKIDNQDTTILTFMMSLKLVEIILITFLYARKNK